MKTSAHRFIAFCLVIAILALLPKAAAAQNRLVGELVITTLSPEGFVTVNGERAASGRSVTSPSDILTSPQATAKLLLPQTGSVSFAPGSKFNLSFVNSSIAGDFLAGEITVETAPNTAINLFTPDGTITTPNRSQVNIIKVSIENGKTRLTTIKGEAMFNIVLVSAGQTYTPTTSGGVTSTSDAATTGSVNPLLILGVLGAVAGAVVIALAVSSNNNDNPVVSPTS